MDFNRQIWRRTGRRSRPVEVLNDLGYVPRSSAVGKFIHREV